MKKIIKIIHIKFDLAIKIKFKKNIIKFYRQKNNKLINIKQK